MKKETKNQPTTEYPEGDEVLKKAPANKTRETVTDFGNFVATDPNAKSLAWGIVILVSIIVIMGFFQTPRGKYEWNKLTGQFGGSNNEESDGNASDFSCPEGINRINFDALGVIQEPYPQLQKDTTRYCFQIEAYQAFLKLEGTIPAEGDKPERKISGLDWLAETISYPNWPGLLSLVKTRLEDVKVSKNLPDVGWIELPGWGGLPTTPTPYPDTNKPNGADWGVVPTAVPQERTPTPTPEPTETAIPTIQVADIPTLVAVTPMPNIIPSPTPKIPGKPDTLATVVVENWQAICIQTVGATSFFELDSLDIWSVNDGVDGKIKKLAFRFEQGGL